MASPFLRLGSLQSGTAGKFYSGALADVRLYNGWLDTNAVAQLVLAPAPLLQLKFDESSGSTAVDATGHGWNGALVNGSTWVTGHAGNAVSLNSSVSNYVSLPTGVVSSLNDFTISAWVKMSTRAVWSRIFDFGTDTGNYMFLSPAAAAGGLRFAITTAGGANEQIINYTNTFTTGVWHHVAVTLAAGTGILYLDGLPVATNSINVTPAALGNTTQNWIGRSQYSADPYLNALVDDFRIYRGALNPGEIASLVTPLLPPAGLTGAYGDSQALLNWNASPNANGYNLKRSLINGGPYTPIASDLAALTFTDASLLNGTNYYYVATATNSTGESDNSIQVSVRPVSAASPQLVCSASPSQLQLTWPNDHLGWILQMQTNSLHSGLSTNWVTLPDSNLASQYLLPIDPGMESVFYRLLSPY